MKQYDQRMVEIEKMLRLILKSFQDDSKSVEKIQKISNSFCIGDHSLLLQPIIQNVKNKYIFNNFNEYPKTRQGK